MKVPKEIRDKIIQANPYSKKTKIEQIESPVDTVEIYVSRRKDGDNAYFLKYETYLSTVFASPYWRLSDFRNSCSYMSSMPDSVFRAMDKDNGGGYLTRRQIIDALYDVKTGSKTALAQLMTQLNWEDENETRYRLSSEIAENRLGRKLSAH
tara:strand:+ start:1697 stop:2152 length:456 start_codon:yes stop_codon:yes gene_type:complete